MPGIMIDGIKETHGSNDLNSSPIEENTSITDSPPGNSEALELPMKNCFDTSIDHLYNNVCEMESSGDDISPRQSFGSDDNESRIDSELRHLVGGEMKAVEVIEEINSSNVHVQSPTKSVSSSQKCRKKSLSPYIASKPPLRGIIMKKIKNGTEDSLESACFLLKHARDLISSDNHKRALKYALRAATSFENLSQGAPNLDLIMSLHVIAAIYCNLGNFSEAVPVLEKSIQTSKIELGQDYILAKFSGLMQLGDTYAMLCQLENSIQCYNKGLELQKQALGVMDRRVGETCRYIAEALVQALQFDEAENLCQMALDIHKECKENLSLEEAADRRLMSIICNTKGDHETALEHLVLASTAMISNGLESEVASVDLSIGDMYLSLGRYDEAVVSYQKALAVFKSSNGGSHPSVAQVYVRLADLYNRTGKFKESKTHCENALQIYGKPIPGSSTEEIGSGFTDVSAIYESMSDYDRALKLLHKALKIYKNSTGQQSTIAGIEAQLGVLHYVMGNFGESYSSLKNAVSKLRACGEKKSAFFGIALNQMGLACMQRFAINEAAELFEEAKIVLERECGPYNPDTLGVYSNLAGTYDAMGRLDEAIEILEYVVGIREEKLGTANIDVEDEKRRLSELLKATGRLSSRKTKSLINLFDSNPNISKKNEITI